jgi:small subunit ribosomal protein S17
MADEPENKNENEAPEDAAPEASEQAESPQAQAPEQAADAPVQDEVEDGGVDAATQEAQPAEQLSPKERRRKARSTHTGETRPARSPQERHAERSALRKAKALRRRARRSQERAKAAERRAKASAPASLAPVHAPVQGTRKIRQGVVVSNKADKTITVRIDTARRHRRYEKIVRGSSTLHAHDENNDAHEGDTVRVIESRPLSRTKRWRLIDVLERAR